MPAKKVPADRDAFLREHLLDLLKGGHAHATFDAAVKNLPPALRGKRPRGAEHSPWEALEHLRIAQSEAADQKSSASGTISWPAPWTAGPHL